MTFAKAKNLLVYANIIKLIAGNNNAGVLIVMSIFTISTTNVVKNNVIEWVKRVKLAIL